MAIDAFFWRFGDLIQALAVYVGLNLLDFQARQFAVLNMALAVLWVVLAVQIGRRYQSLERVASPGEPPRLVQALHPMQAMPGVALVYRLPPNLFHCDPGDILEISVRPVDADKLPTWLRFDPESLTLSGTPPADIKVSTWLTVRATNFEGQWAETRLGILHQ